MRLGHSSEKVTLTLYLRSTSKMDEAAAGAAEEIFGANRARPAEEEQATAYPSKDSRTRSERNFDAGLEHPLLLL